MNEYNKYTELHAHKQIIAVAVADAGRQPSQFHGEISNTPEAIRKLAKQLSPHGEVLAFCYEAGPCDYDIYRQLVQMGHDRGPVLKVFFRFGSLSGRNFLMSILIGVASLSWCELRKGHQQQQMRRSECSCMNKNDLKTDRLIRIRPPSSVLLSCYWTFCNVLNRQHPF